MIFTIMPRYDLSLYMPELVDPFGGPMFQPRRRKKLKGWQKVKK